MKKLTKEKAREILQNVVQRKIKKLETENHRHRKAEEPLLPNVYDDAESQEKVLLPIEFRRKEQ